MGDLDAPGVPDGTEHRLLVVPPAAAHLVPVVPAQGTGSRRSDPAVLQDQLQPPGDTLARQMVQQQVAGPVLVGGGRYDQCSHRESGHLDRHHALGALSAAVGAAAVVEGETTVGCPRARWVSMATIEGVASARP